MASRFSKGNAAKKKTGSAARMPTAWSYSRWHDYSQCPRKYHAIHILKIRGEDSPAMARGTAIHKKGEIFLSSPKAKLPKEYKAFKDEMAAIKKLAAKPEYSYAITRKHEPCEGNDWDRVWLRSKVDASVLMTKELELDVIDFKTGRKYSSNKDQAEVMTITLIPHIKEVETIRVEFWYLDSGDTEEFVFPKKVWDVLRKKWRERADKMLKAKRFPTTPSNDACRFCPIRSDKGGTCHEWHKAK